MARMGKSSELLESEAQTALGKASQTDQPRVAKAAATAKASSFL